MRRIFYAGKLDLESTAEKRNAKMAIHSMKPTHTDFPATLVSGDAGPVKMPSSVSGITNTKYEFQIELVVAI